MSYYRDDDSYRFRCEGCRKYKETKYVFVDDHINHPCKYKLCDDCINLATSQGCEIKEEK